MKNTRKEGNIKQQNEVQRRRSRKGREVCVKENVEAGAKRRGK